jgi:hypothetical protein
MVLSNFARLTSSFVQSNPTLELSAEQASCTIFRNCCDVQMCAKMSNWLLQFVLWDCDGKGSPHAQVTIWELGRNVAQLVTFKFASRQLGITDNQLIRLTIT